MGQPRACGLQVSLNCRFRPATVLSHSRSESHLDRLLGKGGISCIGGPDKGFAGT